MACAKMSKLGKMQGERAVFLLLASEGGGDREKPSLSEGGYVMNFSHD